MSIADFFLNYGLFVAKLLTVAVVFIAMIVMIRVARKIGIEEGELKLTSLNEQFERHREQLLEELLDKKAYKEQIKQQKKLDKEREGNTRPRMFVLDFDGDIEASEVEALREQISAVLQVVEAQDEVLLRLESSGGLVHAYGLAASQLARLKSHKVRLVIAVDKVAASGGYMMACLADHLLAAPFAIVGSVGVVGAVPNINRLLKKHAIDYEQHTAGQHKRTLNVLGENTEEGREQFKRELAITHELFKSHIAMARPALDVEKIATGETWYGVQALENGLIDAIGTSDDYLLAHKDSHQMLLLESGVPQSFWDKLKVRFLSNVVFSPPLKMRLR